MYSRTPKLGPPNSAMAFVTQRFLPITKPFIEPKSKPRPTIFLPKGLPQTSGIFSGTNRKRWVVAVAEELDVIPVQSSDSTDQQDGVLARIEVEEEGELVNQVGGFSGEGRFSFEGAGEFQGFSSSSSSSTSSEGQGEAEDVERLIDRSINATIVLAAGSFAVTKLLTIDADYWHVSQPYHD